jgi:hypothetical protein
VSEWPYTAQIEELRKYLATEAVDILRTIFTGEVGTEEPSSPLLIHGALRETRNKGPKGDLWIGPNATGKADGVFQGVGKWARAVNDVEATVNARTGLTEYRIKCRNSLDSTGLVLTGGRFDVLCSATNKKDDVLFYFVAQSGERVTCSATAGGGGGLLEGTLDEALNTNVKGDYATMSVWSFGDLGWADSESNVTVFSPMNRTLGVILAGMKVEALWSAGRNAYVVVAGGKARWVRFSMTDGQPAIQAFCEGEDPQNTSVLGTSGLEDGDGGYAFYDPELDVYHSLAIPVDDPELETITVLTGYRLNGLAFQVKERSVMVPKADEDGHWATVHTGTTCPE